jgi:hypothetical protein
MKKESEYQTGGRAKYIFSPDFKRLGRNAVPDPYKPKYPNSDRAEVLVINFHP